MKTQFLPRQTEVSVTIQEFDALWNMPRTSETTARMELLLDAMGDRYLVMQKGDFDLDSSE